MVALASVIYQKISENRKRGKKERKYTGMFSALNRQTQFLLDDIPKSDTTGFCQREFVRVNLRISCLLPRMGEEKSLDEKYLKSG